LKETTLKWAIFIKKPGAGRQKPGARSQKSEGRSQKSGARRNYGVECSCEIRRGTAAGGIIRLLNKV
jgi:hypothetical protein